MIQSILAMSFVVGLLCMVCVTPYLFAKGIYTLEYGVLSSTDKIYCLIPVINVAKAEALYMGKRSKTISATILLVLSLIVRLAAVFQFSQNFLIQVITVVILLLCFFIYYFIHAYVVFRILSDADTTGLFSKVLYSIIYPLGQYYIGVFLPTILKNLEKEGKTFG